MLGGNPRSGVTDLDGDPVLFEPGDDGQPAALRHRVPRVEEQIQEDLLQLVLHALDDRPGRREFLPYLNTSGLELMFEQGQDVADHDVDVARTAVDLRRAAPGSAGR